MKSNSRRIVLLTLTMWLLLVPPVECPAWVGLELDGKIAGVRDPYGATGTEGSGSLWEFSGRAMYQESFGHLDTEFHWLGQYLHSTGEIRFAPVSSESPFRSLDLEKVHSQDESTTLISEVDRLSLTWTTPGLSLTAGRQAISWGEAFYFNVGDLFGAFPITETNRRYKPGIDGVAATVNLGLFSGLSLVDIPVEDESDSVAIHTYFPLGSGTCSLTGGHILEDDKAGAGYTVDIAGTQVYGSLLLTRTSVRDEYSQAVLGAERQVGPYTLLVAELYRNGWGTGDPDDYPALILSDEYMSGNVFTLGRYNMAFQVSRQINPLMTLTPAIFANLSDGSALLRLDGSWSLSDLTGLTGGLFFGMGERPHAGIPRSEYGSIPISIYVEIVHNI
ncbi:MAG: hypothetical protein RRA15_12015 [bacterium]|nr:hypothetical protein [bacterium]MDT8367192.1 hypothetical protein [bacterium]